MQLPTEAQLLFLESTTNANAYRSTKTISLQFAYKFVEMESPIPMHAMMATQLQEMVVPIPVKFNKILSGNIINYFLDF